MALNVALFKQTGFLKPDAIMPTKLKKKTKK
jgi:hypothetical protein